MPIVFDEINAEVAPPAEPRRGGDEAPAREGGEAGAQQPLDELRMTLALLHERELRCKAD